jgi:hypothetical protein
MWEIGSKRTPDLHPECSQEDVCESLHRIGDPTVLLRIRHGLGSASSTTRRCHGGGVHLQVNLSPDRPRGIADLARDTNAAANQPGMRFPKIQIAAELLGVVSCEVQRTSARRYDDSTNCFVT